jgi:hypothetical protein
MPRWRTQETTVIYLYLYHYLRSLFGVCKGRCFKVLVAFAKLRPYGTTVLPLGGLFVKFHVVDYVKVCGENRVG